MRSTATTCEVNTDLAGETLIEISPADGGPRATSCRATTRGRRPRRSAAGVAARSAPRRGGSVAPRTTSTTPSDETQRTTPGEVLVIATADAGPTAMAKDRDR